MDDRSGREEAVQAIFYLLTALGESASPLTNPSHDDKRARWLDAMHFLDECLASKGTAGLSTALSELDRIGFGQNWGGRIATRQGGKSDTAELEAMRIIVEGGRALKEKMNSEGLSDEQWNFRMDELGVPPTTFRDHVARLEGGPRSLRGRRNLLFAYGHMEPDEIVKFGAEALREMRKK